MDRLSQSVPSSVQRHSRKRHRLRRGNQQACRPSCRTPRTTARGMPRPTRTRSARMAVRRPRAARLHGGDAGAAPIDRGEPGFVHRATHAVFSLPYLGRQGVPEPRVGRFELRQEADAEHFALRRAGRIVLDLLDPARPAAEHDDALGQGDRLRQIVGDEDHGLVPLRPDPQQLLLHQQLQLGVQRTEGLVHQQGAGLVGQQLRQGNPLAHAAGELARGRSVRTPTSPTASSIAAVRAWRSLRRADPMQAQRHVHVLLHREPRQHRILLRHIADPAIHPGHPHAVMQDGAILDRQDTRDHVHQRGLAAAGRADEGDELAGLDVQIDMVQGQAAPAPVRHTTLRTPRIWMLAAMPWIRPVRRGPAGRGGRRYRLAILEDRDRRTPAWPGSLRRAGSAAYRRQAGRRSIRGGAIAARSRSITLMSAFSPGRQAAAIGEAEIIGRAGWSAAAPSIPAAGADPARGRAPSA